MSEQERWEPGDIVRARDGAIWQHTTSGPLGTVWRIGGVGSYWDENQPLRPLTLLVRNGKAVRVGCCLHRPCPYGEGGDSDERG